MQVIIHKADSLIESSQAFDRIMRARTDSLGLTNALLLCLTSLFAAAAANDFQNLGFESASLIPIAGDGYNRVEASAALPGWTVYVDTNQIGRVLHNNMFLDSAGLAVMGPEPGSLQNYFRIEGNYTILLQGGTPATITRGFIEL